MVNTTLIIVIILVIAIWLFIELKRFRHKIVAIFLILLVIFTYVSFTSVLKKNDVNIKTFDGMKEAGQLYFVWIGHAFQNVKVITANAIHMDWEGNSSLRSNKTKEK